MLTCISCTLFMWGWGWVGGENFNWRPKAFMLSDLWQFFSLWLCFLTSDLYDVSLLGWTFLSVIWVFLMVESFCLQSGKAEAEKVQADFSNLSRKEELEVCVNFHFLSHWWISDVQNPSTSCYPTEYMAVWMYVSLCLCLSLSLSACLSLPVCMVMNEFWKYRWLDRILEESTAWGDGEWGRGGCELDW